MKKKLTSVALMLTTVLAATGCNDDEVTLKKDDNGRSIIYTLNGENVVADDLLAELVSGSTARTTLYNEVSRQVFSAVAEDALTQTIKDANRVAAEKSVTKFKENCKSEASDSEKDYTEYLEDALEAEGVESIEELEEKYYYQNNKEDLLSDFVEDNYSFFLNKYLECYTPFQVKHILVAANTADTNYADGTMTADNARKLLTMFERFENGESFASVSDLTDDTSSKDNGGVMPFNQGQNYVSEFRFAPYVLEIFDNNLTAEQRYAKAADLKLFSSDEKSEDYLSLEEFEESDLYTAYVDGIQSLNWETVKNELERPVAFDDAGAYNYYKLHDTSKKVINDLKDGAIAPTVAEQEYEMNVEKFNDDGEINNKYYEEYEMARNQVFNKYLNKHEVRYIEVPSTWTSNYVEEGGHKYLAENGNKIYVVLASTGLHFMLTVHAAYNNPNNEEYFKLYSSSTTNLADYANTYIGRNQAYEILSTLTSNSSSLLSDITSYVSSAEYYLFYYLVYATNEKEGESYKVDEIYDVNTLKGFDSNSKYRGAVSFSFNLGSDDANKEMYDELKDYIVDSLNNTDEEFVCSTKSAVETYAAKIAREKEVQNGGWDWDSTDKVAMPD